MPKALVLHGMTGSAAEMEPIAKPLRDRGWYCLQPTLAGHGTTVKDLGEIPLKRWISDSLLALDTLHGGADDPVALIGFSFSCLLCLNLALQQPEKISKVVLIAPPFKLKSRFEHFALKSISRLPNRLLNRLGSVAKSKDRQRVLREERAAYDAYSVAAAARALQLRDSLLPQLGYVKHSVFICYDPYEHLLAPEGAEKANRRFQNSRLVAFPNGEHELLLGKHSGRVVESILDFLRENAP